MRLYCNDENVKQSSSKRWKIENDTMLQLPCENCEHIIIALKQKQKTIVKKAFKRKTKMSHSIHILSIQSDAKSMDVLFQQHQIVLLC